MPKSGRRPQHHSRRLRDVRRYVRSTPDSRHFRTQSARLKSAKCGHEEVLPRPERCCTWHNPLGGKTIASTTLLRSTAGGEARLHGEVQIMPATRTVPPRVLGCRNYYRSRETSSSTDISEEFQPCKSRFTRSSAALVHLPYINQESVLIPDQVLLISGKTSRLAAWVKSSSNTGMIAA